MRVIAFEIWGDYAHFRKHYTTSSPLTHSIPPPSALRGLVGAMMGLSRKKYPELLSPDLSKLGVRLLSPVKKMRIPMNYIDTKDGAWLTKPPKGRLHTQVRVEFLKDPHFEIFFSHKYSDFMDKFVHRLKEHQSVYTPYLGITECIGNFKFHWDSEVDEYKGISEVVSVFRVESLKEFKLKGAMNILKERIPIFINSERIREKGDEIIFNPKGKPILAEVEGGFLYPCENKEVFTFIG